MPEKTIRKTLPQIVPEDDPEDNPEEYLEYDLEAALKLKDVLLNRLKLVGNFMHSLSKNLDVLCVMKKQVILVPIHCYA